ncbi:uncharacterized protein [Physcomitrium patens]|uniref:uncharacterized protein isoform X6 n=1 Tax=Physcomitrium patens TaxID=3218 RepID=UPI003CCD5131
MNLRESPSEQGCYDNSKPPYENQVIYNFMGNYTVQGLFQHQEIERVVLIAASFYVVTNEHWKLARTIMVESSTCGLEI